MYAIYVIEYRKLLYDNDSITSKGINHSISHGTIYSVVLKFNLHFERNRFVYILIISVFSFYPSSVTFSQAGSATFGLNSVYRYYGKHRFA
jgi:hypothetical protein